MESASKVSRRCPFRLSTPQVLGQTSGSKGDNLAFTLPSGRELLGNQDSLRSGKVLLPKLIQKLDLFSRIVAFA